MNTIPNTAGVAFNQINTEYKSANNDTIFKPVVVAESTSSISKPNPPSADEVIEALSVVNKAAVFEQRSLSFMMDEASGRSVVKVLDKATDQVIRQIPSEELLKVAQDIKRLQDEMGESLGFLIDRKV